MKHFVVRKRVLGEAYSVFHDATPRLETKDARREHVAILELTPWAEEQTLDAMIARWKEGGMATDAKWVVPPKPTKSSEQLAAERARGGERNKDA